MRRLLAPYGRIRRGMALALALAIVGAAGLSASGCGNNVSGPEKSTEADPNNQQSKPAGPPFIWDED